MFYNFIWDFALTRVSYYIEAISNMSPFVQESHFMKFHELIFNPLVPDIH